MLRFRDLGCFVFDLGCFVFEIWVLRFRVLGCFVLRSSFSSASFSFSFSFCQLLTTKVSGQVS